MSHQINHSDSLSFNPTGYTGATNFASENTTYPWSRGYNSSSYTTNYARFQLNSSNTSTDCYIYYTFSISGIPSNATINSVSCTARISRNSRVANSYIQLFNNTSAKGSAQSFSSTQTSGSNVSVTTISSTGSWTASELSNMRLRIIGRRSNTNNAGYIYFWGATVTIQYTYNDTAYYVTVSLDADSVASIDPSTTQEKLQGEDYELTIYADSLDGVDVYDNAVDVKNQLVRHIPETSGTITAAPSQTYSTGFSTSNGAFYNGSNTSSSSNARLLDTLGHTAESPNTTNASSSSRWTYVKDGSNNTATGWIDYNFDFSSIPANATNIQVEVKVYGARESSTTDSTHMAKIALYSGSTMKSSEQNITSTTNTTTTVSSPGTWTRTELQSAKLRFTVAYYGGWIGGISWKVTYEAPAATQYYWTYALTSINDDHDIVISEDTGNKYLVTVENTNSEVSNLSFTQRMVTEGNSVTLTFTTSMLEGVILTDNQIDVTNSITSSANQRSYTISNVTAAHTIRIQEKAWHEVVCESLYGSASISTNKSKVYTGGSFTVTVSVSNLSDIDIKDNGSTLQLTYVSNGVYTATISNVTEDHEIIVNESNAYQITAISNTSNATISPSGITSARQGTSKAFTIVLSIPIASVVLKDNGQDVTNSMVFVSGSQYQYTLSSISADHTINLFEIYIPEEEDPEIIYHSVTISSINATTSPSNGTVRVEEGDDLTITIMPSEQSITLVTDNGVDITSELAGATPTTSSYTVTTQVSGAGYGFNLDSGTGFYESTNAGQASSTALCRVNFALPVRCLVTIAFINSGEETYDFGVFGKVDTALSTTAWNSSSSGGDTTTDAGNEQLRLNTSQYNSTSQQTINYEISAGNHFIDIKYSKDQASNDGNDSLQWKITDIQPLETLEYTYTLTNIEEDHSILLIFGEVVYYTTTAIIDDYAKLNPNGTFVLLPGEQYSLIVIPDGRNYEVTMTDNNRDVTSKLELLDTEDVYYYVYTIKSVTSNHVIYVTSTKVDMNTGLYIKVSGSFVNVTQVWVKESGSWDPVDVDTLTNHQLMFFNSSN